MPFCHQSNSRIIALDVRRVNLGLFWDLLGREAKADSPRQKKGPGELVDFRWSPSLILMHGKSSKGGRKLAWINKFPHKVETGASDAGGIQRHCLSMKWWGQESQSPPEVEPARDLKSIKGCYRHVICYSKWKMTENMSPLLWAGDQVTKDTEKFKVLKAFFALVFTGMICLQDFQARGNVWNKEDSPGGESD